ncbi:MAG: cyclic nucleotide-binding domain-containing protein [Verrucomicrobiia bacterium]
MLPPELMSIVSELPSREIQPGDILLEQGHSGTSLFILLSGTVEVERSGTIIARESTPGAVFGEISALLHIPHTATVRAATPGKVHVSSDGSAFLRQQPEMAYHLARILATRLQRVSGYLADLKRQYGQRDDNLSMVDEVIEVLLQRQTIRGPARPSP